MAVVNTEISMKFSTLISQNTVVVELAPESDETALDLLLIQRTGVLRVEGPSYLSQLQAKYQKKDQKVVPLGESIVGRAEQDIILEDLDAEVFQESGIGASELDTDNIQVDNLTAEEREEYFDYVPSGLGIQSRIVQKDILNLVEAFVTDLEGLTDEREDDSVGEPRYAASSSRAAFRLPLSKMNLSLPVSPVVRTDADLLMDYYLRHQQLTEEGNDQENDNDSVETLDVGDQNNDEEDGDTMM